MRPLRTHQVHGRSRAGSSKQPLTIARAVIRSDLPLRVPPATWIVTIPELLNLSVPHSPRGEWAVPCACRGSSHRPRSGTEEASRVEVREREHHRPQVASISCGAAARDGCACTPAPTKGAGTQGRSLHAAPPWLEHPPRPLRLRFTPATPRPVGRRRARPSRCY